jgi:hypothetical protein
MSTIREYGKKWMIYSTKDLSKAEERPGRGHSRD